MDRYSTSMLIIVLVAVILPFTEGGGVTQKSYWTVNKSKAPDGTTLMTIIGPKTFRPVSLKASDDQTIFRGNGELVIGNSVYGPGKDDWGKMYKIVGKKCYVLEYDEESDEDNSDTLTDKGCDWLKQKMYNVKQYLFPILPTDNFRSAVFQVQTKQTDTLMSFKVVGRGILDCFVFWRSDDPTVINKGSLLIIGEQVYTETHGELITKRSGICYRRKYEQGDITQEIALGDRECFNIWMKREAALTGARKPMAVGNSGNNWKNAGNKVMDSNRQQQYGGRNTNSNTNSNTASRTKTYGNSNSGRNFNYNNYNYNNKH